MNNYAGRKALACLSGYACFWGWPPGGQRTGRAIAMTALSERAVEQPLLPVPLVLNHDRDHPIASTEDGTLACWHLYDGIFFQARVPADGYVVELWRDGLVVGASVSVLFPTDAVRTLYDATGEPYEEITQAVDLEDITLAIAPRVPADPFTLEKLSLQLPGGHYLPLPGRGEPASVAPMRHPAVARGGSTDTRRRRLKLHTMALPEPLRRRLGRAG